MQAGNDTRLYIEYMLEIINDEGSVNGTHSGAAK